MDMVPKEYVLVPIKRLDEQMTEASFELDFSAIDPSFAFEIDEPRTLKEVLKSGEPFIAFKSFRLETGTEARPETVEELEEQLARAVSENDFERPSVLRDKITRFESGNP